MIVTLYNVLDTSVITVKALSSLTQIEYLALEYPQLVTSKYSSLEMMLHESFLLL